MYALSFNGEFELEYPYEFLADLVELQKKHNCDFYGQPILRDLGHYVDFQRIEPDVKSDNIKDCTSESELQMNEKI